MKKYLSYSVFVVLAFLLPGSIIARQPAGGITVSAVSKKGAFPLVKGGAAGSLYVDKKDARVVAIAAAAFKNDIQLVTGATPRITGHSDKLNAYPVIIGTIGQSALVDQLIAEGKLSVDRVKGKWETFIIAVVNSPFQGVKQALVVAGSDRRGTAFGVFELSGMIGVSPIYWWADVTPAKKKSLYVHAGSSIVGPPSVQYRGIFINDEGWGLQPWAGKHLDADKGNIGPKTYEKVFELLLRLKANYIWPAMFYETKAFYYYPENPQTADDYAIIVGSSHCEQMLRNNIFEWSVNFDKEYKDKRGPWRYDLNKKQIYQYWDDRVAQSAKYESTYMIGMRGVGDSDMPGPGTQEEKIALWNAIVKDQRGMLEKHLNKPASQVPQIFCPYNEVLDMYRTGKMNVYDDINMLWVDDNHGYVRQLPTAEEQKRGGGNGMYYHFSYLGGPQSFIWLSTVAPALTSYEMTKSFEYGASRLWIFNVGDIKPAEMEIELAMEMAWDIKKWTPEKAHAFPRYWAAKTFGEQWASRIAAIKTEFFELANSGKPEYMVKTPITAKDADARLLRYKVLADRTVALGKAMPARLKDAYYQLIEYPVLGSYYMNQKSLYARRSVELAKYGDQNALRFASMATAADAKIWEITRFYNKELSGGKWDGMMVDQIKARWFDMSMPPVATDSLLQAVRRKGVPSAPKEIEPVRIKAASFVTKKEVPGKTLQSIKGLGISGEGVTVMPFTATSVKGNTLEGAPYVEYKVKLNGDSMKLIAKFLPTHAINGDHGLRYAVTVNNSTPVFINLEGADQWRRGWGLNVLRGYNAGETRHAIDAASKESVIRIYLLGPGLVLNEIDIFL